MCARDGKKTSKERVVTMEFKEVVKNRYSCKKYSERKVDRAKLNDILEAGRLAPTAKNSEMDLELMPIKYLK